jgi:hypothetical protein
LGKKHLGSEMKRLSLLVLITVVYGSNIFVSPKGSDLVGDGSFEHPVASLAAAQKVFQVGLSQIVDHTSSQ